MSILNFLRSNLERCQLGIGYACKSAHNSVCYESVESAKLYTTMLENLQQYDFTKKPRAAVFFKCSACGYWHSRHVNDVSKWGHTDFAYGAVVTTNTAEECDAFLANFFPDGSGNDKEKFDDIAAELFVRKNRLEGAITIHGYALADILKAIIKRQK